MARRWSWLVAVALLLASLVPVLQANAQQKTEKERGLLVSPLRAYPDVAPGKTFNGSLTVANITKKSMSVNLTYEQFTAANYTYGYRFTTVNKDWIHFQVSQFQLKPGKSQKVNYTIAPPADAKPGGHYFTIFASASLDDNTKIRTAEVLYVTVDGDLVRTSVIERASMPRISFGGDLPFNMDVRNTGNTHFFIYVAGRLEGLFSEGQSYGENAHILLPETVRTVSGSIAPPLLPGVYKAVYGYRTDGGKRFEISKYIIYAPVWSWAVLAGLAWFVFVLVKRQRRLKTKKNDAKSTGL